STGFGLEHVIQFSSSAVGSPDQLSYQVYVINSQTKERIFDVMTAASGSSFNPLPSTNGTLLIEFRVRGGDADINFDGVVDVHDINVLTSGISSGVSIPYYD